MNTEQKSYLSGVDYSSGSKIQANMKFNKGGLSPRDRKNYLRWKQSEWGLANPTFLVLVERIGSRLEMVRTTEYITPEHFAVTVQRLAPKADTSTVANIVRELLNVWTFANLLPNTVREMQYHGILPSVIFASPIPISLNSYVIEKYVM